MTRISARTARRLAARPPATPRSDAVPADQAAELEHLVPAWLTVPQVGERLDLPLLKARQLLADRQILGVRRGENAAVYVPEAFVAGGAVLRGLPGLITLLADCGFSDAESVRWLFTPDESLPGTPVEALAGDRGTEVRRRAQALAL